MKYLADNWHKAWSAWLLAGAITVAELHPYLPDAMQILPPHWYKAAFAVILIARIVRQQHSAK